MRTALALSLVTQTPLRVENIRAKRSRPGLLRQHLAAVKAAEAIGAEIDGAEIGATEIAVRPGPVRGGDHRLAVGSAGSAVLVLQTVLPALLSFGEAAHLRLEGGTHNPYAPPFDFLERVFAPVLERMGASLRFELERPGFYPAGGGAFTVDVAACSGLRPIEIMERGAVLSRKATALVAHLPGEIAKRELSVVERDLAWSEDELQIRQVKDSSGPGNVLLLEVETEHARELCAGFGERGVKAETVAKRAVGELCRYLDCGMPVGVRLADQLMVPFALARGGAFRTLPLSNHSRTNLDVIRKFLPVTIEVEENDDAARLAFSNAAS